MMTREERNELDALKRTVEALRAVTDVAFIQSLKRNALTGAARIGTTVVATTITQAVRNAADSGSQDVAKVPDGKMEIIDASGTKKYIGVYNS